MAREGWMNGRTDRQTESPWLLQRSALQAMRTHCNKTKSKGNLPSLTLDL